MTTWHQARNSLPLWHATLWTIVIDDVPSGKTRSIERHRDAVTAQRALERLQKANPGAYIIPPHRIGVPA